MKRDKSYDQWLIKSLKDPKEAAAYLNAALEDEDPRLFLIALYDVARAYGIKATAEKSKVHRVSLNKMLSKRGNPEWKSISNVLAASRIRFRVEPAIKGSTR